MKTTFLAFIFSLGIIFGRNNQAPYVGKWRSISSTSSIKEVVFFQIETLNFPIEHPRCSRDTHYYLLKKTRISLQAILKLSMLEK
ncbi:hypothetical protein ACTJKN_26540 [Pedobacter sp. 22163]|uniref:hypothetical protein n=1 Tax=Pedobacter sp. 22163 TaxID=3453883 RepID=UPI003F8428CE